MRSLRQQVDRIDLKILHLLQQRTKLSARIGQAKRRHGADIYVPERERELLARVTRLSKGKLPAAAVASIYRQILSSSRAAQGQAPIGYLKASAASVLVPGRWCFGACDEFAPKPGWPALAAGLKNGTLAVALLSGDDLVRVLQSPAARRDFQDRFSVVGDLNPPLEPEAPLARRIFIVTAGKEPALSGDRMLILIECKSTMNAVKSLFNFMPQRPLHTDLLPLRAHPGRAVASLLRLTFARPVDAQQVTESWRADANLPVAGMRASILGVYPGNENYGG